MTITKPDHTTHCVSRVHYMLVGKTRFYCVQPNCDGAHHVWCNCGTRH